MKQRTSSYIFTADPKSVTDMQQIEIVRKTVRASNRLAMDLYNQRVRTAKYFGEEMPKPPTLYRVRLMGRGPRRSAHEHNIANGGYAVWSAYACYLPQRYATSFDVYVNEKR